MIAHPGTDCFVASIMTINLFISKSSIVPFTELKVALQIKITTPDWETCRQQRWVFSKVVNLETEAVEPRRKGRAPEQ